MDSEFFIRDYSVLRRDRNCHGGGVLIAVLNNFPVVRLPDLESTNAELLMAQNFV